MFRRKAAATLATLALTATGLLAVSAGTAQAGALACNDTARNYVTDEVNSWPHASLAATTSNCYDINVKPSAGTYVRTCFVPSSGGWYCNSYRWISGGVWGLAATDVKDGTKFYLDFDRYSTGRVSY
ncbi:hypothetical protein OG625_19765 [Streptomyces sp. NBC_01351]|uniref:hypothetical protein n=1 Tax=Streptomyces sp. NBC_01351 TaxID=2903833 RepID=UPI002E36FBB0|nr:hypothetical protein [Streptomyces sp. NBC_01351]